MIDKLPTSTNEVKFDFFESGVALLTLGSKDEKAVSLITERMASLEKMLQQLKANPHTGLVIAGPNNEMFTVGADIMLISSVTNPIAR